MEHSFPCDVKSRTSSRDAGGDCTGPQVRYVLESHRSVTTDTPHRELRSEGLEVWDCEHEEYVLIVPWVLAMLGDNPMHSELLSHIGLTGRRCCRVCDIDSHAKPETARLDAFMKVSCFISGTSIFSNFLYSVATLVRRLRPASF